MLWWLWVLIVIVLLVTVIALHDIIQKKHTILRNFPVIGHLRFLIDKVGPELRQYIVADNDEELPFSGDRRWFVYASAKKQNAYFGFGTDNDLNEPGYVLFRHSAFPHEPPPEETADLLSTQPGRICTGKRIPQVQNPVQISGLLRFFGLLFV